MRLELQQQLFLRYPKFFRKPGRREFSRCISPCHDAYVWDYFDPTSAQRVGLVELCGILSPEMEAIDDFFADNSRAFDKYGVECGDGWFGLVDGLAKAFEEEIGRMESFCLDQEYWPRVAQIKEKLGSLRFYVSGPVSTMLRHQIIEALERSYAICSTCGGPRHYQDVGNLDTDCERCAAKRHSSSTKPIQGK